MEQYSFYFMAALIGLIALWLIKRLMSRPKKLPPGPSGIHLIGVAWELIRGRLKPLDLIVSWTKKYGAIFCFYVVGKPIVFLNSYEAIVEAFRHPNLQDRSKSQLMKETIGVENNGIALANGDVWKEQRKFVHTVFRSLGVSKKSYEDTVATEIAQLTDAFRSKRGAAFDPHELFGQAVANIMISVVSGTQYKYDDADFVKILDIMNTYLRLAGGGGALLFLELPGISKIPLGSVKLMVKTLWDLEAITTEQLESHEKNWDQDNPKDFIDLYLNKIAETKDTNSSFTKRNLQSAIGDLYLAGSETTTTTLKWCFLYMMAYPEVQSRVQDELDHVIGRDRLPRMDDRKHLPYTNAVLMEAQRKGSVGPLGLPHVAAADTAIRGYIIPKGAIVVANVWAVLNSVELWEDSHVFKPERFLSADGELIKRDELIFFGTGPRVCLGQQLAQMETFLGFTSLLHRFTFTKPINSPPISLEGVVGFTRNTEPYMMCAIPRN